MQLPTNLVFAGIDFEHESLLEGLLRHGVKTTEPAFFSWLGVTMYLTEAAIEATLKSMGAFPEGSEVVLTFLQPSPSDPHALPSSYRQLAQRVAESGEPFISFIDQATLERKLVAAGFSQVEFLTPEIAQSRYFQEGQQHLPMPKRMDIASARR